MSGFKLKAGAGGKEGNKHRNKRNSRDMFGGKQAVGSAKRCATRAPLKWKPSAFRRSRKTS